jgi:hypothetical protein
METKKDIELKAYSLGCSNVCCACGYTFAVGLTKENADVLESYILNTGKYTTKIIQVKVSGLFDVKWKPLT